MAVQLNYSRFDRLLHRVAFAGPGVQLVAADIEKALFGSVYATARGDRPIFITSLPRAGTTLLLEALHRFPSLATHIYRDMPFVMAPIIWSRVSGVFQKPAELKERAHGDGIEIGYDSPEAFEEMIWRTFWPEKYLRTRISLWSASDCKSDGAAFFADHMKKIIALRRPHRLADGRYISKNNGNIARLDVIGRMCRDATVLLVVRHPLEHARSLLRQHRSFLSMHRETPFVRKYMSDIGHYEFGELHRPIAFPGLDALVAGRDPLTLDYWLAYWIAAFEHARSRTDKLVIVSYEAACKDPTRVLSRICARLEIPEDGALPTAAALFKSERSSRGGPVEADPALIERAGHLHGSLVRLAQEVFG